VLHVSFFHAVGFSFRSSRFSSSSHAFCARLLRTPASLAFRLSAQSSACPPLPGRGVRGQV
jgi:hypothetical protein